MKIVNCLFFMACIFFLSCKKDNPIALPTPKIILQSVSIAEGNTKNAVTFKVFLDGKSDKNVTVNYKTVDILTTVGSDYEAKTGVLTFPANTTEGFLTVTILGDSLKEPDEPFAVLFTNPTNAILTDTSATCTLTNDDAAFYFTDEGYRTPTTYQDYILDWSDEFNGTKLNTTNWMYNTGGNGWGNNELQNYTNREDNTYIYDGKLVIEAKSEAFGNNNYTSARLSSQGKKSFTYGRVDIRARVPIGQGIWPALWMLGSNIGSVGWPLCGEIDIMEVIGKQPKTVFGTMHWRNSAGNTISKGGNTAVSSGTMGDVFHVFSIIWDESEIKWYLDDVQYHVVARSQVGATDYPFNKPFFFLINVAVGGNWPGKPDATTIFPQRLLVDYIRVFKKI
jgi:beta-glucanase (GH16 family)